MIGINSTLSMIIGGSHQYSQFSPLTFWYYHGESKWVEAPSLNYGRQEHANGIIVDQVTKEKLVIVTGGDFNGITLDSTEILFNSQWNQGNIAHYYSIFKGVWHRNWPIWLKLAFENTIFP